MPVPETTPNCPSRDTALAKLEAVGGIDFLGQAFPEDPLPVAACWATLAVLLAAALWVLHRKVRACEVSR